MLTGICPRCYLEFGAHDPPHFAHLMALHTAGCAASPLREAARNRGWCRHCHVELRGVTPGELKELTGAHEPACILGGEAPMASLFFDGGDWAGPTCSACGWHGAFGTVQNVMAAVRAHLANDCEADRRERVGEAEPMGDRVPEVVPGGGRGVVLTLDGPTPELSFEQDPASGEEHIRCRHCLQVVVPDRSMYATQLEAEHLLKCPARPTTPATPAVPASAAPERPPAWAELALNQVDLEARTAWERREAVGQTAPPAEVERLELEFFHAYGRFERERRAGAGPHDCLPMWEAWHALRRADPVLSERWRRVASGE